MKRLIVFIPVLVISLGVKTFSCGFYDLTDDLRFSIFNPLVFKYKDYQAFNYTSQYSYSSPESEPLDYQWETSLKMNLELWRKRCGNVPALEDIYEALYYSGGSGNNSTSQNSFMKYLNSKKDIEALEYLDYLQKINELNTFITDPWERKEGVNLPIRNTLINEALVKARAVKDNEIKVRYAFLAIRLAYYNNNLDLVKKIYREHFSKRKHIIDYWGLHFRTWAEPNGALCNYYAAQVFANAPDKRFEVQKNYDKKVPVAATLKFAKNNKERAAIWLLAGIKNHGQAMEYIKNLQALAPNSDGLSFLLLREINKLEDWIYTPYYTNFAPSIVVFNWGSYKKSRITRDREYAQSLLNFINSINIKKKENLHLWKISKVYLYLMTNNYNDALKHINSLENEKLPDEKIKNQLECIKALCLVASQAKTKATIPEEMKPVIIREEAARNFDLIFAIGRELEMKENTTDAAFLFSKLNIDADYVYDIYWDNEKSGGDPYSSIYQTYFTYLDINYTPQQLKEVIETIRKTDQNNEFNKWKIKEIYKDIPRLNELMGTKYIRINDLKNALKWYEKVDDSLWVSNNYNFKAYLNANPFYTNFYNEHKKTEADTIIYNKETITRTLINYLKLAENKNNSRRSYNYFLAANCYFNMTTHGNSWMMRRYYWSAYCGGSGIIDDNEYLNCNLARQYYLKAGLLSKNRKFSALCLRMAARCQNYKLRNSSGWDESSEKIFKRNKYYTQIKTQYPKYYNELVSNCESFDRYFNSGR